MKDVDYESMLRELAIPPRPEVLAVMFEEVRRESPDFARITKAITADPAMSAGLLRIANSPFYGLSRKVSSLPQAIKVLGLKNVVNIAHALALRNAFKSTEQAAFFGRFWDSAEKTARLCHFLARSVRGVSADEAYTYGLFHDCGVPLLVQRFPDFRRTVTRASEVAPGGIVELEEKSTSTSHAILGYFLARSWMLPDALCQAILLHHDRAGFDDMVDAEGIRNLIGIGHLAEHIQHRWLGNLKDPEWERFRPAVEDHFGLSDEDVANLIDRSHSVLEES